MSTSTKKKPVGVPLAEASYNALAEFAKLNDMTIAAAARYCIERFFNIAPDPIQLPEGVTDPQDGE